MSAQILTTSNICVETIESMEDEFNIVSNNNVIFETDNILIGNVSFTEFCSNIVFGVPINEISSEDIFKVDTSSITEITNMSEYELLSIDCTQITSDETYETGNKEHYINIQGKDKIYIRSENIYVKHHSYNESFHDYTYRMINNKSIDDSLGRYHFSSSSLKLVPVLTDLQKNDRIADVTNMGTYVTKKILCNAVTTENIYDSTNKEAQLKLKSNSAIRLNILDDIAKNKNNIFIEDDVNGVRSNISLNQYINYRLDEYGLINIDLEAEPGVDITIYFNQNSLGNGFSNYYNYIPEFQKNKYKVNFKIVLNKPPTIETNIPSIENIGIYDSYHEPIIGDPNDLVNDGIIYDRTRMIDYIFQDNTNTIKYPMTNLTAGNFYNIYADVTNNYTGITYYNILTSAVNVPTIEHVVINDIKVINEREIEIDFSPHVTVVPTWYNDPNKLVYFSVKLYDHGDSSKLSNGTDFTYIEFDGTHFVDTVTQEKIQLRYDIGRDKDIDVDIARTNRENTRLKYRFDVNTLTNYNNPLSDYDNYSDSVIKLEGLSSDASRATSNHTFSIVSNHIAGNFEMISIPEFTMPTESFVNPNAPTNFTVQYPEGTSYPPSRNNIFQWTRSINSDSRITKLFYEIFKDTDSGRLNTNDMEDDLINSTFTSDLNQAGVVDSNSILQNIGEISTNDTRNQVEGIIPGTYKIRAYNFFGQRSVFTTYEVTQLILTNVKLTPILHEDKRWTVSYNVNNQNGTFVVTTDVTTTSAIVNNSTSFMTDDFNSFTTYDVWVQIQDTAMKIRSSNISVRIDQPIINISAGVYTGGASKDRRYTFTITINTKSLNDTTNFSNLLDADESLKIRSLTNVTSINNISNQSISATNNSSAIITFTVNDLYANIIHTNGETVSYDENVSFSLTATDVYGYSSASTTLTNNIVNISFPDRSTNVRHTGNREFDLNPAYSSDFIGYEWQLNNSSLGKTNSTLSFLDHEDNGGKFGDFRCKIRQQNAQGFTRYFYSASLNNPEPVINYRYFEIRSPTSYTFRYDGSNNTASNKYGTNIFTNNSTYQNDSDQIKMITKGSVSMSNYKTAGVYKLEVFVRNQYFFGKYLEIGTYEVLVPTVPSITFGSKTYKSIRINYTLNANGRPNQNPTSVKLYMDTNSNPGTEKLTITNTNGSIDQNGLLHNTTYYFKIIKSYGAYNYDSVQNTPLSIQTYNKPTAPSITNYTRSLTSITVTFNLGSNSDDPTNNHNQGPRSFNITIDGPGFDGGPTAGDLTSTSRTFTKLLPNNRNYNFTLSKTYDNPDFGIYTVTGSSTTTSVAQATAPSISYNSNTSTSITVNLSTNNNGSATSGVTYTLTNGFSNTSSPPSSYRFENLEPSTYYNFTFTKIIGSPWKDYPYYMTNKSATLSNARTADLSPPLNPTISSSSVNGSTITINYNLNGKGQYTGNMTASLYYSTSLITNANLGSSYISLDTSGSVSVSTTPQYVTATSQETILDTLTHNIKFSLENYVINNALIGNNGITVNGITYTTSELGRVQSDGTHNYLEMQLGKLILPTYLTPGRTTIDNTFYFVVKAQNEEGIISRMTSSDVDHFNICINFDPELTPQLYTNTGMYPFIWPTSITNDYILSTTFRPKDSYIIIVLKILYKSGYINDTPNPITYDARIQFIAKPDDGAYITLGPDQEVIGIRTSWNNGIDTTFILGHGIPNFQSRYYNHYESRTDNFKLYEFGVLDSYVSDSVFDTIVTDLKNKYFNPTSQVAESQSVDPYYFIIKKVVASGYGHIGSSTTYSNRYSEEPEPVPSPSPAPAPAPAPADPTIQISDNWRLVNHNGRGIDYGNADSLIGVRTPTIGTNRFPIADYTLDYVKSVANTYDTAAYIVDNRRAVHLSYYIHDAVHGDYHVYTPNINDPHDGLIFVYTRNDYDSTDLETQGTTFTGWKLYDSTNYYGTFVRDWLLISDYPYNTANVEYILGLGEASVATKHVVYNENQGKWFFVDDNPPSGGTPIGGEQWYSPIDTCKVWSKTYSTDSWTVYSNYDIDGGGTWNGAPSGEWWVLQSEYTLNEAKAIVGDADVFIVKGGDGTDPTHRYYFRVNDGNNKLGPKPDWFDSSIWSYVKSTSTIEYH
jgi:hypothetical protein